MSHYVDAYIIPIKKSNLQKYKKMAKMGCKSWMKHGALHYYECYGDEFVAHGLGFKKLCKLKANETFIFAFVIYKTKAHRNAVNKKVMTEMEGQFKDFQMPFDMKRFSVAGCKTLVHSK